MHQIESSPDAVALKDKLKDKWPAAVAVVLVALLVAAATRNASHSARPIEGAEGRSTAAYARILQLSAVLVAATDAETCSQGYLITGDAGFLTPLDEALSLEAAEMRAVESLYADDAERGPMLREVRAALAAQRAHMLSTVALRRSLGSGDPAPLLAGFRGRELTDSLRVAIKAIVVDEQSMLARDRARFMSASFAGTRTLVISVGVGVVLLSIVFAPLIRERRRRVAEATVPMPRAITEAHELLETTHELN